MKRNILLVLLVIGFPVYIIAQNIQVDSQSFSPQELIEDILVDSNCVNNVVVTNVVGGDFGGNDQSYGYFDATGTSFPFQDGIVLSTGRLQNTQGPNDSLSDDDAPNWIGDLDIEAILDEQNTTNATILEFDFTSMASEVSFRYIFASEEYQEGNPNTCLFSDLFGFLIRETGTQAFTNIALVPNTQTPVKVTTVHPEIPGGCPEENEFFFESFNGTVAPINFNGQTKVLTATATIQPNTSYSVKLVIADEQNFRFDSAVFLEGGSFQLSTDLGEDRLISTDTALCPDDTITLDATLPGNNTYTWFRNEALLAGETAATLDVDEEGIYEVTIGLDNGCESFGEIIIEFGDSPMAFDTSLQQCDINGDGFTQFNLLNSINAILNGNQDLIVTGFFLTEQQAETGTAFITNQTSFQNTTNDQIVFARVENQIGCFSIAQVTLSVTSDSIMIPNFEQCDTDGSVDGFFTFALSDISASFQDLIPAGSTVQYYLSQDDALFQENEVIGSFTNMLVDGQILFVRVANSGECFAISSLNVVVLVPSELEENTTIIYCLNTFPQLITLEAGAVNASQNTFMWQFNGLTLPQTTENISVNEIGTYTVTATNVNGCTDTRTLVLIASNQATILDVTVTDGITNPSVVVSASGEGDYEFALDDPFGVFQESSTFINVSPGFHVVYVRDRNGCGLVSQEIGVVGFPKFFTPNGDGIHDTWKVQGSTSIVNPVAKLAVFDRFGKILFSQRGANSSWNGVYNGQLLGSNGYWYLVTLEDGRTFRGGFSLIR